MLPSQMYFNQLTFFMFSIISLKLQECHSYHSLIITAKNHLKITLENQRSNADSIVTSCSSAKRENFNQ